MGNGKSDSNDQNRFPADGDISAEQFPGILRPGFPKGDSIMRDVRLAFRMVLAACWGFTALLLFSMTVAAAPPAESAESDESAESARVLAMRLDLGYAGYYLHDPKVAQLAVSAVKGDVKEIDRLIDQGVDPNAVGKHLYTPLSWAMNAGSKKGFGRLLDRGAKFDSTVAGRHALADGPPDRCLTLVAAGDAEDSEWLKIL